MDSTWTGRMDWIQDTTQLKLDSKFNPTVGLVLEYLESLDRRKGHYQYSSPSYKFLEEKFKFSNFLLRPKATFSRKPEL